MQRNLLKKVLPKIWRCTMCFVRATRLNRTPFGLASVSAGLRMFCRYYGSYYPLLPIPPLTNRLYRSIPYYLASCICSVFSRSSSMGPERVNGLFHCYECGAGRCKRAAWVPMASGRLQSHNIQCSLPTHIALSAQPPWHRSVDAFRTEC